MKHYLKAIDNFDLKTLKSAATKIEDFKTSNLLLYACKKPNLDILTFLLDSGLNPNQTDNLGQAPLHLLSEFPEALELLVLRGADVNLQDSFGNTPLFYAVTKQHRDSVLELFRRGAEVNTGSNDKRTVLMNGAERESSEIVNILLLYGGRPNLTNYYKVTSLHLAAEYNRLENCQLLVKNGANIDAQDNEGYTPLHRAAQRNRFEICRFLINAGVDHQIYNNDRYRAFEIAPNPLNRDIIEFVIDRILAYDPNGKEKLKPSTPGQCIFCQNSIPVLQYNPCQHILLCDDCYINHKERLKTCPMCKKSLKRLAVISNPEQS